MRGVISFDLDGVLANFTRNFTRIANRLFKTPIGDSHSQESWMFEDYPPLGLDKAKCDEVWKVIKSSKDFWANLDPLNPSIMFSIEKIKNKIFITNRPGELPREQSVAFLERWGVYEPKVIVAADKGPVALTERVTAHLDDYYPNVLDIHRVVPSAYTVLFYTNYNRVHHEDWRTNHNGPICLSVDQFIYECNERKLIEWS